MLYLTSMDTRKSSSNTIFVSSYVFLTENNQPSILAISIKWCLEKVLADLLFSHLNALMTKTLLNVFYNIHSMHNTENA